MPSIFCFPSGDSDGGVNAAFQKLVEAQGYQDLHVIRTVDWLHVGHLDEVIQVIPSDKTGLGFTIAIADPDAGDAVLQALADKGHGE